MARGSMHGVSRAGINGEDCVGEVGQAPQGLQGQVHGAT